MSTTPKQEVSTENDTKKETVLKRFEDPRRNTAQFLDDSRRHTDARSMREHFGLPGWDRERFAYPSVIPNCLEHYWDPPAGESEGGTDWFARGKPGKGKSTLANYLAVRLVEINDEIVVWRGSSSRSEWLPLAPWVRLCLPSGVNISASLDAKDPRQPSVVLDVDDLEEIVREIVYYDTPRDLNRNLLKQGVVHVVYPDPRMRGCQAVYEDSDERTYEAPSGRNLFSEEDPATHWWFGWLLARIEHGPYHFTTWLCDEVGDIFPQSAQKDSFGTYQKVELTKDAWVDARKLGLTIGGFGHSEKDVHQMIREKLRWRIQMPHQANPTTGSKVVGFDSVPMNSDMTSRKSIGKALAYTETNFELFSWKDMPSPNYNLTIKTGGA